MLCVEIGDKLALARRYHAPALGQKDLAEILGVDTSTVGRWESKNHIPPDKLPRIAALLNVKEEWFFDNGETPPTSARRVPVVEPPNVQSIDPADLGRVGRLLVESMYVALPVWRGVSAGSEDECAFYESETPEYRETPLYLTLGHPEQHVLCIASGQSMAPRIEHSERALVRLDPDVPPGHIVIARSPEQKNYVKRLVRTDERRLELHSLNAQFKPITKLEDWELKGGVTAILHTYEPGVSNIEWDEGRYLRA